MEKLFVVTVYIHSDDREGYSKIFSTREKATNWIKKMINYDVAIGWEIDKGFTEDTYNNNHGCVMIFWNHQENWNDFAEYTWSEQTIDEE